MSTIINTNIEQNVRNYGLVLEILNFNYFTIMEA